MTDLVEKVAWAIWPDETRPLGPTTHDLARLIIPIVQEDLIVELWDRFAKQGLSTGCSEVFVFAKEKGLEKAISTFAKSKGLDFVREVDL